MQVIRLPRCFRATSKEKMPGLPAGNVSAFLLVRLSASISPVPGLQKYCLHVNESKQLRRPRCHSNRYRSNSTVDVCRWNRAGHHLSASSAPATVCAARRRVSLHSRIDGVGNRCHCRHLRNAPA